MGLSVVFSERKMRSVSYIGSTLPDGFKMYLIVAFEFPQNVFDELVCFVSQVVTYMD